MNDNELIELYFARAENAIAETDSRYGTYCRGLTFGILGSREDSEECVNDTYLKLWNTIPPTRPLRFAAYISSIARSLALNMRRAMSAKKRGGGDTELAFDEISECLPSKETVEDAYDENELVRTLDRFLGGLSPEKRKIFMLRYYHFQSVADIASELRITEEKVRTTLHRTREKLRKYLEKEGIDV